MKKVPCVFVREFRDDSTFVITPEVTPGCEWVLAGEGHAYIKRDGTACAVIDGRLFKRYDAKRGKSPPAGAVPCTPEPDEVTGHWPHWVEVTPDDKQAKWHWEAWAQSGGLPDGTYELCGPHFQANPEQFTGDQFISHVSEPLDALDRTFKGLHDLVRSMRHEGVVFHHPDGRMAKIRRDDFGFHWDHR